MTNKKTEKANNWTNRDWYWLLGVLIGIIILLIASIFAKNLKVEMNFSIISSAVSMALALVAIFIALNQSRDNEELSSTLKTTMAIMNEKLNSVDEKVNKIDPDVLSRVLQQKIDDVIIDIKEGVNSDNGISPEEVEERYNKELNQLKYELNSVIDTINNPKSTSPIHIKYTAGNKVLHKKWGMGNIVSVRVFGDTTELDIDFGEEVGIKRLLAEFAPIVKVD